MSIKSTMPKLSKYNIVIKICHKLTALCFQFIEAILNSVKFKNENKLNQFKNPPTCL